jgi:hypothetical protein
VTLALDAGLIFGETFCLDTILGLGAALGLETVFRLAATFFFGVALDLATPFTLAAFFSRETDLDAEVILLPTLETICRGFLAAAFFAGAFFFVDLTLLALPDVMDPPSENKAEGSFPLTFDR